MRTLFLILLLHINYHAFPQFQFDYEIMVKPKNINGLPGLQSFAFAQLNQKWLFIGGRLDGLHARQPFNAFPQTYNNTTIFVVDETTSTTYTSSVNSLPASIAEQMQSTNMNFYQDGDTLYIIGGYGYSPTAADHITFPSLTSIDVPGLINAVINNNAINGYFKQITDTKFAVCGARLGKLNSTFYLIGGHRFDGRYNPMGNPTYTQTYVSGIRKFKLDNSGSQLSFSDYTEITDQVHLHRRDYNLMPQIYPNGEFGYLISSGVFQVSADLPFLYPVEIKSSGYYPISSFNQYLSNYHSASAALYDSTNNIMHSLFFGGMSQYHYVGTTLTQDNYVPFIKTISRVSRNSSGNYQEFAFNANMPDYLGSSAEFILNETLPRINHEIFKLSQFTGDSVKIGHIVGGIMSASENPFTNNSTNSTSANNTVFEVWLVKSVPDQIKINGDNPYCAKIFPNPASSDLSVKLLGPEYSELEIFITDISGKIIWNKFYDQGTSREIKLNLQEGINLNAGTYMINIVINGKYSLVEKLIIK